MSVGWSPPSELEEYRLLKVLGQGGMGTVWLAEDQLLRRQVAIKIIRAARPGAEERERFLIEARAIARLRHPNVIEIYRVGTLGDRHFLVYEYLRGRDLEQVGRPVELPLAHELALGIARGLAAAHRRGVLHRDLKLSNVFLTDEGEVKLIDFGLAKLDGEEELARPPEARERRASEAAAEAPSPTLPGELLGTPSYLAPELWRREPATSRSDVYAFGVALYRLLVGRAPHEHEDLEELEELVCEHEPPELRSLRPEVPEPLAAVVMRCLRRVADERFASGEEIREALEGLAARRQQARPLAGNPYRGLLAFEEEHRGLFFGRELEVSAILERLRSEPWVVVAGRSGVGKSSFVRAAVLPLIEEGALGPRRRFQGRLMVPGVRPLEALVTLVGEVAGRPEAELGVAARDDPGILARVLRSRAEGTVIVVDQLEELFTLSDGVEREGFCEALRHLVVVAQGVRVLATLRSDFLERFDERADLREALTRGLYLLGPMTREGLREAVVRPAEANGIRFEADEDVAALVDAAASTEGGLPLLEFALAELWDRRDPARGVIPREALARIGGLAGALAQHADGVIARLPADGQARAKRLLLRLATTQRTRARRTEGELFGAATDEDRRTLDALVRGRLLTSGPGEGGAAYELAHEALVTGWPRLRLWLEEDDTHPIRERLELAARDWEGSGRPEDQLWSGRRLGDLEVVAGLDLPTVERAFLDASRARARQLQRRALRRRIGLVAALFAAVAVPVAAQRLADRRFASEKVAGARSRLEAARARDRSIVAARERAFSAFDRGEVAEAERLWSETRTASGDLEVLLRGVQVPINEALARLPSFEPALRAAADLHADRVRIAEREHHEVALRAAHEQQLAFYDRDGHFGAFRRGTGTLSIDSLPPGAVVTLFRHVDRDGDGRLEEEALGPLGTTPIGAAPREMGSYVLALEAPGMAPVRYPVLVRRAEARHARIDLVRPDQIPEGFVFVPGGPTLFGSPDADSLRQTLDAQPLHDVEIPSFFMARHEVTYADWIAYLDAQPPGARAALLPRTTKTVELVAQDGGYALRFRGHLVRPGEVVSLPGRDRNVESDWRRWPVVGVSYHDVVGYARWLAATRVPGARLCTEREWERAARGADGRRFPTGERLWPADANFWQTYGRSHETSFLDEVGRFPASKSLFGVLDLAGNAFEWVEPSDELARGPRRLLKGGSWENEAHYAQAAYRLVYSAAFRGAMTFGARLCRDAPR